MRPIRRFTPHALVVAAFFATTLSFTAPARAQPIRRTTTTTKGAAASSLPWVAFRLALIPLVVAVAGVYAFRFKFPSLLEQPSPRWPIEAYGVAWAWFWGIVGLAMLPYLIFLWPEFTLKTIIPGLPKQVPSEVDHWAIRAAVLLLTVLAVTLSRAMHQSEAKLNYSD